MKIELFNKLMLPLKRSISIMVAKALIKVVKDTEGKIQLVQVDLGNNQITSNVERLQPYGFTSNPKNGAQAVVLSLAGNRDHQVVIVADDSRFRPSVSEGDSLQYNDKGVKAHCKGDFYDIKKSRELVENDGLVTGLSVDPATGIPFSLLPGPNTKGKNVSLVVRGEL